ncbi:hypothetical protein [Listeria booriae]|uniref:hypothetical protein n=1 Tax=Listeria booriae TaxID=1552123 RepID=UPI00164DE4F3|nr:hypothetical protein [Listeria booriae]MBC6301542.1 hypothetical protein [Listeria booriae]
MDWMQRIIKVNDRNFNKRLISGNEEGLIFQTGNYIIQVDAYTEFVSYYQVSHQAKCVVYPCANADEAVSRAISLLAKGVNRQDVVTDEEIEIINKFGFVAIYDTNYNFPVFFRERDITAYLELGKSGTLQQINGWVEEKMDIFTLTELMETYDVIIGRQAIFNEVNRVIEICNRHGIGNVQSLLEFTQNQNNHTDILYEDFNRCELPVYLNHYVFRGASNLIRNLYKQGDMIATSVDSFSEQLGNIESIYVYSLDLNADIWDGVSLLNANNIPYYLQEVDALERYWMDKDLVRVSCNAWQISRLLSRTGRAYPLEYVSVSNYDKSVLFLDMIQLAGERAIFQKEKDLYIGQDIFEGNTKMTANTPLELIIEGLQLDAKHYGDTISPTIKCVEWELGKGCRINFHCKDIMTEAKRFYPNCKNTKQAEEHFIANMNSKTMLYLILRYTFIFQYQDKQIDVLRNK